MSAEITDNEADFQFSFSLQWGRARMSAEMARPTAVPAAAMAASTGPRSDERGNSCHAGSFRRLAALQWGRARMSAEIRSGSVGARKGRPLQWGRARMSAEMKSGQKNVQTVLRASMGPRSDERGNFRRRSFAG